MKDSYLFFANAIINLTKEEETAKQPQANDSTTTTIAEAVVQTAPPSNEQASPTAGTPMESSTPTSEKPLEPPKTKWFICVLFFVGLVAITFLFKKSGRSKTASIKKQYKPKDYDSTDYRDDK